jgi:hypothetical protein
MWPLDYTGHLGSQPYTLTSLSLKHGQFLRSTFYISVSQTGCRDKFEYCLFFPECRQIIVEFHSQEKAKKVQIRCQINMSIVKKF